jgi:hypothetical protein
MFIVAGIQSSLFLGGWQDPFGILGYLYHKATVNPAEVNSTMILGINLIGAGIFSAKCLGLIFVQMWIRWTLPRPRIDQVLYACIKVLLPMACVMLLGAALWQLLVPEQHGVPWWDYRPFVLADWHGAIAALVTQIVLALIALTMTALTTMWVVCAFLSGRNLKQRLTDPAPIETEVASG